MKTFQYGLKQGIKSIWQNRLFSLAAIGTIAICLFLLGLFYAIISNFEHMVYNAESSVGVTVFLYAGISQEQIDQSGREIRAYKTVDKVTYVSAEEAWKKFQKEMNAEGGELEDTFGEENPLKDSASYEVYLTDVSNQENIVRAIQDIDGVRKVNSSNTVADGLSSFNALIAYISATIILLLILVSVFLISSAVAAGIRVRKDEISIMQYIGATETFVKMPFIIEGIFIGMIGAVVPLVVFWFVYEKLIDFILTHFSALSQWLTFVGASEEFRVLIPMSLLVGVGIGFAGSAMSVRKHLVR